MLVALLALLPAATAQAAPPTCTSFFRAAEDDGRPTGGSVGCRGPLDVPLKTEIVSRPTHGTLTDIEDRTWPWGSSSDLPRYTPTAGYRGPDAFTIRATVAGESVEHVVKIDVIEAVDDPPVCSFNWTNVTIAPGPVPLDAGETWYGNVLCGDDEAATLDIAVLHVGGVQFPVTGPARYTMTGHDAVELTKLLSPRIAIPIHYEGWKHFVDGKRGVERAVAAAPSDTQQRFRWLTIGEPTEL